MKRFNVSGWVSDYIRSAETGQLKRLSQTTRLRNRQRAVTSILVARDLLADGGMKLPRRDVILLLRANWLRSRRAWTLQGRSLFREAVEDGAIVFGKFVRVGEVDL